MIAGGGRDHAARTLLLGQLVRSCWAPRSFEREHLLRVFALEQDLITDSCRQSGCPLERRLDSDVVYAGAQDLLSI